MDDLSDPAITAAAQIALELTEIALEGADGVFAVFDRDTGDFIACVPTPPVQLRDEQVYAFCPSTPVRFEEVQAALDLAKRLGERLLRLDSTPHEILASGEGAG